MEKIELSEHGISMTFYVTDEGNVALCRFSLNSEEEEKAIDECFISEVNLSGSDTNGRFGVRHVKSSELLSLKYKTHLLTENEHGRKLEIVMSNGKIEVTAHYQFYSDAAAFRAWKTVKNISSEPIGLEYVASFTYTGIDRDNFKLYVPYNSWCNELRWRCHSAEELAFCSKSRFSVSNSDSWSTGEHAPMGAVEWNGKVLMWQIENNGAWQWELCNTKSYAGVMISGPTEQENSWYKSLLSGESFESVKTGITLGKSFDEALSAMTDYRRQIIHDNEENRRLPVIFNDYMHCLWADPTEEKMVPLIDRAAELGCEYYCMDAGWYADGTWWDCVGVWEENNRRFPNGIKKVFDYIRSKGMVPGIWLETEVMGVKCPILDQFDDSCFFMKHGKRIINRGRYLLDFRNEKVRDFATKTVDRVVSEYGAGYIKFDYNSTTGKGTDYDSDSFGDGLLEHNRAYLNWIRSIKAKYPSLIIENCSSGGLRMDYAMLSEHHIQSISDQEQYTNTAYIAAAAPTAVLPEQSGVWACVGKGKAKNETEFLMVNALLQRLYLSGRIDIAEEEALKTVKEGVELFKSIRSEIPSSHPYYPLGLPRTDEKVICLGFDYGTCRRITVWSLSNEENAAVIPVEYNTAKIIYPSDSKVKLSGKSGALKVTFPGELSAAIIELK